MYIPPYEQIVISLINRFFDISNFSALTWVIFTTSMPKNGYLHEKVAEEAARLIHSGAFRPGDKLPSVRKLCQNYGISLTTAVRAYLELENIGLIEGRPKSGFYVRAQVQRRFKGTLIQRPPPTPITLDQVRERLVSGSHDADMIPMGPACPNPDVLPVAKLGRFLGRVAREAGLAGITYTLPPGSEVLRRQISKRSPEFGCALSPDDISVTSGCLEAVRIALQVTTTPGAMVAMESPTNYCFVQLLSSLGLRAYEVPTNTTTGIDLDALEAARKNCAITCLLLTANFSNPLGTLLSDAQKKRIAEMAAAWKMPVIEDDIYGDLYFGERRPKTIKSFDLNGWVILCSSFSKTLAPGYRVGWAAPGRFLESFKKLQFATSIAPPTPTQLAMAEFLRSGGYEHFLRGVRQIYQRSVMKMREAILDAFPKSTRPCQPQGGFLLWVELDRHVDTIHLYQQAVQAKISLVPGPLFSAHGNYTNCLRLSCALTWSPRIEKAIKYVGELVRRSSEY